ncbi:MAG: hypothetical protein RMK29_02055 [Myxococcales bacterium]|nr:hypothetical protein [Myxococcota bacterium]MDW8280465.1 hypothetical protein [Myxococcales bacterium]
MRAGAALGLLVLLCVCNREGIRTADEALLVSLSQARAWQRRADLHLQGGDVAAAIEDVKEVLKVPFPPGATEAEDVRLDARARLAQLYLKSAPGSEKAEAEALEQVQAGLREATRDSFFRAHLESVLAEVYEARAQRVADPAAQAEARRLALQALERAIQIDRRLQHSLLGGREAM